MVAKLLSGISYSFDMNYPSILKYSNDLNGYYLYRYNLLHPSQSGFRANQMSLSNTEPGFIREYLYINHYMDLHMSI